MPILKFLIKKESEQVRFKIQKPRFLNKVIFEQKHPPFHQKKPPKRKKQFDPIPCFSSMNPSLDTPGVTGLFLQLRHTSATLYHLNLDLVFVPQHYIFFLKLILCLRFSRINFVVSVSFVCFFWFYCTFNTQQGGHVHIILFLNKQKQHQTQQNQ